MENLNVSVFLCEKCDDDVKNIYNIFDKVKLDEENKASFTSVIFINGFRRKVEKLALYFFMQKVDIENDCPGPFIYLNSIIVTQAESFKKLSTGENQKCIHGPSICEFIKAYLPRVPFLGKGEYEIQAYMYENDEIFENPKDMSKEARRAIRKQQNLVAVYDFEAI